MIALIIIAAYLTVGLIVARHIFLKMDTYYRKEIREKGKTYKDEYNLTIERREHANYEDALGAACAGVVWPITVAILFIGRPTKEARQLEARRRQLEAEKEMKELEREFKL